MGSLPVGLSASRGAAIIGLSKWSTPFDVWQQIMESRQPGFNASRGYEYIPFEGNNATDFGSAFEEAVISLAEQGAGNNIIDREGAYSVEGQDYITCHIDGRYALTKCNHEGKTTNSRAFGFSWGEPGTDRVPQEVQVQVQQQMMCNGSDSTIVSVLVFPSPVDDFCELGWKIINDPDYGYMMELNENNQPQSPDVWAKVFAQIGNFHTYHIEAKPDTQKILKELYEEFWRKYILEEIAPDAVDYSDIKKMFTSPKGVLVVDEKQAELMREYKDITKEIGSSGHLAKRKTFIRTGILKHVMANTTVADEDAVERVLIMDQSGKKLGSYNGKSYRS